MREYLTSVTELNRNLEHSIEVRTRELTQANKNLQEALEQVKKLSGLLPICASCKKIRDDKGYWNQIETYISNHSEADFSHGLCPVCQDEMYGEEDWYKRQNKK
jgi:hypothetical protein